MVSTLPACRQLPGPLFRAEQCKANWQSADKPALPRPTEPEGLNDSNETTGVLSSLASLLSLSLSLSACRPAALCAREAKHTLFIRDTNDPRDRTLSRCLPQAVAVLALMLLSPLVLPAGTLGATTQGQSGRWRRSMVTDVGGAV